MHNNDEFEIEGSPSAGTPRSRVQHHAADMTFSAVDLDGSALNGWCTEAESPPRHRVPLLAPGGDDRVDPLATGPGEPRQDQPAGPSPGLLDVIASAVGFTSPDVPLSSTVGARPLCPALAPLRGTPSFGRKGDAQYAVDTQPAEAKVRVAANPIGPPSVRFLSIYSDIDTAADAADEADDGSATLAADLPPLQLFARHERLVKHPVSVGCIKGAGLGLVPPKAPAWHLYWGARWRDDVKYRVLRDRGHCRVNHFPKSYLLGRKDNLARALQRASLRHGKDLFGAVQPRTLVLPQDAQRLSRELAAAPQRRWIMKPSASSRGRGIQLFIAGEGLPGVAADPSESDGSDGGGGGHQQADAADTGGDEDADSDAAEEFVVQEYLERPLLINGFKVDFRLYCVVTSFDPLLVYVYNEGLVRFAATPYDAASMSGQSHLTNFSVQKGADGFVRPTVETDGGSSSKWTLHACRRFFEESGWDWDRAWANITRSVTAGLVAVADEVASATGNATCRRFSCFELYGVDVMLDADFNAHLIEFNVLPSLGCGSALDKFVKGHLVADALTLVGVPATPPETAAASSPDAAGADVQSPAVAGASNPRIVSNDLKLSKRNRGSKPDTKAPAAGAASWPAPIDGFAQLADGARAVIAESENQLSRMQGFSRVFPPAFSPTGTAATVQKAPSTSNHDSILASYVVLCGAATQLVAQWEAAKVATLLAAPALSAVAARWLRGEDPPPSSAPVSKKRAVPKPKPEPTVEPRRASLSQAAKGSSDVPTSPRQGAAAAPRKPAEPRLPRVAQAQNARRASVTAKGPVAPLAVQQFTFVHVAS